MAEMQKSSFMKGFKTGNRKTSWKDNRKEKSMFKDFEGPDGSYSTVFASVGINEWSRYVGGSIINLTFKITSGKYQGQTLQVSRFINPTDKDKYAKAQKGLAADFDLLGHGFDTVDEADVYDHIMGLKDKKGLAVRIAVASKKVDGETNRYFNVAGLIQDDENVDEDEDISDDDDEEVDDAEDDDDEAPFGDDEEDDSDDDDGFEESDDDSDDDSDEDSDDDDDGDDDDEYEPAKEDEVLYASRKGVKEAVCVVVSVNRSRQTATLKRKKDDKQFKKIDWDKFSPVDD